MGVWKNWFCRTCYRVFTGGLNQKYCKYCESTKIEKDKDSKAPAKTRRRDHD